MALPRYMSTWFTETNASVNLSRTAQGLPTLVPNGKILIGQEQLPREHSPPRIVLVPRGVSTRGAMPMQSQANAGQIPPAKPQFLVFWGFEAHFWGDPDPAGVDDLYSFDSCIELMRCFFAAFAASATIPMGHPLDGEWVQPTDVSKYGRLLMLNFELGWSLNAEPYTTLPYSSTVGDGGVARLVTVTIGPNTPVVIPPIPP